MEQRKSEMTTKGSDRSLETKTPPNIVDPEHATRHAAETLGAVVALHTFGSYALATNFSTVRSTLDESCAGTIWMLTGSA